MIVCIPPHFVWGGILINFMIIGFYPYFLNFWTGRLLTDSHHIDFYQYEFVIVYR